jgi:tetratricopeptide (TPR) repeat protein
MSVTLPSKFLLTTLRSLLIPAVFFASAVQADEYADVNNLLRAGQVSQAMAKAEQYLAKKPRDPQMNFIKGVIQSEAGKPVEAISTFTQITQDYPELPEPYNNLAVLYAGQNQFDKAKVALEMAIRTNPSYATAHENLGDVYAKLASQAYSKALQLDSSNAAVKPKLALIRDLFTVSNAGQKTLASNQASGPVAALSVAPVTPAAPAAPAKPVVVEPPKVVAVAPPPKTIVEAPPKVVAVAPPPKAIVEAPPKAVAVAPAAVAPTPPAASPAPTAPVKATEQAIEGAVQVWAKAWSDQDMGNYLAAYSADFDTPGNQSRKAWEQGRRDRIVNKARITVTVNDLNIDIKGNKATVKFKQEYRSDVLNVSGRKTLDMTKTGERWLIMRETTGS